VPKLDARQLAEARLLANPGFGDAEMFGKLTGVQQAWKSVAVDVAVAVGQEPPCDLRFERFERRCALCDQLEGVADLLVCECVGAVWMRDQVVERDFWRCGHGWLAFSKSARPA